MSFGIMLFAAVLATGCAHGANYIGAGPRYTGGDTQGPASEVPSLLRVVTFNVYHATRLDSAISVLRHTPELRHADVVALQEVDAPGTARIAHALGMRYVYYPASRHPRYQRDFGNALLTRWPIVSDRKIELPHLGRFRRSARTATAATITVGGSAIRVYSVHLHTQIEIGPGARRDQVRAVIADAAAYPYVIILGDMNSRGIGEELRGVGYKWPTEDNPRTLAFWNWDHVFVRGLNPAGPAASGVIADVRGSSDHRPVWALVAHPPAPAAIPER